MDQDRRPPPMENGLRRRILGVYAASTASALIAVVLFIWGERMGVPAGWAESVGGIMVLVSGLVMIVGFEPARRDELNRTVGTPQPPITRAVVLEVLGFSVLVALVSRFVTDVTWADAIGRIPAIAIYLTVFQVLARRQRRGVPPWIRPAGYGFALAGLSGGLVWAVIAGEPLRYAVSSGLTWSLMHYIYVRVSTRGAAAMLDRKTSETEPPLSA